MTDQELRDLVASLAGKHAELAEAHRKTELEQQETSQQLRESAQILQENAQQLRELGRQIGGLGDKFGSFTEELALPSMQKILTQRFNVDVIAPRLRSRRNGHSMEVDVLAYTHAPDGDAYVVEVKSHLREEALEQMRKILRELRDYFPEHRNRKLHGILAAVDVPDDLRNRVLSESIYLARIHDGVFELQVPEGFQPRNF